MGFKGVEYVVSDEGFNRSIGIDRFIVSTENREQLDALFHIGREIAVKKIVD